jgi:ribosome-associated heat shock protein Hsp15
MQADVRIDKWLWAIRIFKTRSQATDNIRSGKVRIKDQIVKPSRLVKPGEVISINLNPLNKTVKVLEIPGHRIGAKLVEKYMEDLTPQEEYDKLKVIKGKEFEYRQKGIGRPTKKERRTLEILKKQLGA